MKYGEEQAGCPVYRKRWLETLRYEPIQAGKKGYSEILARHGMGVVGAVRGRIQVVLVRGSCGSVLKPPGDPRYGQKPHLADNPAVDRWGWAV
jgi:hypothetical protein